MNMLATPGRIRSRKTVLGVLSALATMVGCTTAPPHPTDSANTASCVALKGQDVGPGQARVLDARVVPDQAGIPGHCLVNVAVNDSTLRIEARLPLSGWNGKMVALGGGGFKGEPFPPHRPYFSPSIIQERYATMATNGGYDYPTRDAGYFKAEFAYDPVKYDDYTHLSIHRSLPIGKALVTHYYGQPAKRHYFEGCSAGGHEGMMLSQRFPSDFDGIVARAPAGNFMGLFLQFNQHARAMHAPGGALNESKRSLLAQAVLQQCDGADGLKDGIVSNPAACRFDPNVLRCQGGQDRGDQCLSDAQIHTVKSATTGFRTADGAWSHPGVNWGGEDNATKGWGEYLWPLKPAPFLGEPLAKLFSDGFVRSFVTRDPAYDTLKFNPDDWRSTLSVLGMTLNAFNPDLTPLHNRGAKLILWNGQQDTAVSPKDTARYYESVVKTMGQATADETVELFLAPGVGHCSGGPAPDRADLMKAMVNWVEQGTAPSRQGVVHSQLDTAGHVVATRPMCKYPAYPRYVGQGDPKQASSFVCTVSP
jgi:feruloyl esterase